MRTLVVSRVRAAFVLLVVFCPLLSAQTSARANPKVNQDSLIVADFENEVKEYVKLHKKAQAGLPSLKSTDSEHEINQHQRLLADNIRAARPKAKQGDIFAPEISQCLKRLIATSFQGPDAAKVRASLRRAEPVREIRLQVNAAYPDSLPLQSTPPSVLMNLPVLPPELDYRIVGNDLVLRDVGANLIVDYLPGAVPPS